MNTRREFYSSARYYLQNSSIKSLQKFSAFKDSLRKFSMDGISSKNPPVLLPAISADIFRIFFFRNFFIDLPETPSEISQVYFPQNYLQSSSRSLSRYFLSEKKAFILKCFFRHSTMHSCRNWLRVNFRDYFRFFV